MSPVFATVARERLVNPPLELVVAQLRFPYILDLADARPPASFHKRIRAEYPVASPRPMAGFGVGPTSPIVTTMVWAFEDAAQEWTVSLTPTFVSLETKRYSTFENFVTRFVALVEAVRTEYGVSIRDRLGLRFVNHFAQQLQPEMPDGWLRKIRPELVPLNPLRTLAESVHTTCDTRLATDNYILAVKTVVTDGHFPGASVDELILDIDCYTDQRSDLNRVDDVLKSFRQVTYQMFRWAIGDLFDCFAKMEKEGNS